MVNISDPKAKRDADLRDALSRYRFDPANRSPATFDDCLASLIQIADQAYRSGYNKGIRAGRTRSAA